MIAFCKKCKKRELVKYMTGYSDFYFCDKCEYSGIAEEMVKQIENQPNNHMTDEEREYNIKSFEKMLRDRDRKFNMNFSDFDDELLEEWEEEWEDEYQQTKNGKNKEQSNKKGSK